MTDATNPTVGGETVAVAAKLTESQREALRPCAADRRCLLKIGLAAWSYSNPRHRSPNLKLTSLGYEVRNYLGLTEPKDSAAITKATGG
jgi:hypothetical protein